MQTFDVVLKLLLQRSRALLTELAGITIESWLQTELPRVQNLRLDLLALTIAGHLVQLEFQSTNDPAMALRMAEYSLYVYRLYEQFPLQLVLYVGRDPVRMADRLEGHAFSFSYRLVDLHEMESGPLLASPETSDNVLGILTRIRNERETVQKILERIAKETNLAERALLLDSLLVLARLRGLEETVEEEAVRMPVLNSILENKVLGREYKRGQQEGRQEGLQEGRQEGRQEGQLSMTVRAIESRFGPLPEWARAGLGGLSGEELGNIVDRLFQAKSLEDLLA